MRLEIMYIIYDDMGIRRESPTPLSATECEIYHCLNSEPGYILYNDKTGQYLQTAVVSERHSNEWKEISIDKLRSLKIKEI